jgi:hypothetical protein
LQIRSGKPPILELAKARSDSFRSLSSRGSSSAEGLSVTVARVVIIKVYVQPPVTTTLDLIADNPVLTEVCD